MAAQNTWHSFEGAIPAGVMKKIALIVGKMLVKLAIIRKINWWLVLINGKKKGRYSDATNLQEIEPQHFST